MTELVVRRIEELHTTSGGDPDRRLGRHVEHDPRSREHAVTAVKTKLHTVLWPRKGKPFDQGNLGSCTGNALAGALNTIPFQPGRKLMKERDAVKLYEQATLLDPYPGSYPPDDTGSSGLAVCKAAKAAGLILAYKHAFSIKAALAALMFGPVITGVEWTEGFDRPDANGLVEIAGQVRGGHEFEVLGYDPPSDMLTAVQSWGPTWGDGHGFFHFTSKTWAELLARQGDVTVPIPLIR